jgi:hypothetical protein
MSLLLDIQGEQTSQKRDMSTLQNMVNEVFCDKGYIQVVDQNEAQNVDDNNKQDIDIDADLEEVVERPSKKQKKQVMIVMLRKLKLLRHQVTFLRQ